MRPPRAGGPPEGGPPRRRSEEDEFPRFVEIDDGEWSSRGELETARFGRQMLVWQGIPGERATARLEHVGKNQIVARWEGSDQPHPDRVEPACDKYTTCGGCALMHLTPSGQEAARRRLVTSALVEAGLGDVVVGPIHPSPDGTRGFRHVIKVAIGHSDNGRIRIGAWGRRNRHVIPIPDCLVAAPVLKRVMTALAHHVIDLNLHPYDPESDRGVLRSVVLRASRSTGEVLVTLVAGRHAKDLAELAQRLGASCNEVVGVWVHLNDGPGNAIFERDDGGVVGVKQLVGKGEIEEKLGDVIYRIGPGDFFQTNPGTAEVLYQRAIDRLQLAEETPFVDLYSGVGGLALPAAKKTGWALGVEEVEGAVLRAREAARRNDVRAEFVAGRVEDVLPDVAKRLAGARPTLSVNPARRGLEPGVVEGIIALRPTRIAYVSCNPRAMARDLLLFKEKGFSIGEVEMFDMFPNTPHVETLVVLEAHDAAEGAGRRAPRRKVAGR